MDDLEGCENQEEEAEAMVEESPSGIVTIIFFFNPFATYMEYSSVVARKKLFSADKERKIYLLSGLHPAVLN